MPSGHPGERLGGHEFARAADFAASACRDELAFIVSGFQPSPNIAQTASLPGGGPPLIRYFALAQVPFTPPPSSPSEGLAAFCRHADKLAGAGSR